MQLFVACCACVKNHMRFWWLHHVGVNPTLQVQELEGKKSMHTTDGLWSQRARQGPVKK